MTPHTTSSFYLEQTPTDGVPYWDTGAPGLAKLKNALTRPADPFNAQEPVDSSAAAIAAQGLIRLGRYLTANGQGKDGAKYSAAGLTVFRTLLQEPYLSANARHQGLLLHSVYHRPNGWDYIPKGRKIPCGEACMWGDYHLREVAYLVQQLADGGYYAFAASPV
jgi:unsaturated chondroitin disaccharide hydrolase